MLMMDGGLGPLIRFWTAIRPPKVLRVSAQASTAIVASGAAAEAHSASRIASPSSPPAGTPGFAQLFFPDTGAGWTVTSDPKACEVSPNVERKVFQSAAE